MVRKRIHDEPEKKKKNDNDSDNPLIKKKPSLKGKVSREWTFITHSNFLL